LRREGGRKEERNDIQHASSENPKSLRNRSRNVEFGKEGRSEERKGEKKNTYSTEGGKERRAEKKTYSTRNKPNLERSGIVPDNLFEFKSKTLRLVRRPRDSGMVPVKLFKAKELEV
jgi:hypothetical protein